jgi:hypothetical protein
MRRRGAASWAWTCSTGNRCGARAPFLNEVDEDERRPKMPTENETGDLVVTRVFEAPLKLGWDA